MMARFNCFSSGADLLTYQLFSCDCAANHLNQCLLQLFIGLVKFMSRTKTDATDDYKLQYYSFNNKKHNKKNDILTN